jgi:hypothetical protein
LEKIVLYVPLIAAPTSASGKTMIGDLPPGCRALFDSNPKVSVCANAVETAGAEYRARAAALGFRKLKGGLD